jgi:phytoene desaturase
MLTMERPRETGTPDTRPHAVVIGSGFGGLAAAVRLGARGYRVSVIEQLEQAGGRASVFVQDGFTFDAGPTIITAPFLFEELWALCGKKFSDEVDLRSLDPFYRIVFDDGGTFECMGGAEAMRAEVARIAPGDVAGYEKFLKYSEEIYRIGFEKLAHVPFGSMADMARLAPELLRLGGQRSVHGAVSRFVKNDKLRFALSFHPLFVGGNPFTTTAVYCLISYLERRWGVHFAMGGTGRLVQGLVGLIEGQGGRLRLNSEVTAITHANGVATGVTLASGEHIAADVVVSNADAAWTYSKLLKDVKKKRWSDAKLKRARYSMSLVVWYFGTKRKYDDVPHHTILLGPRYKGLISDIFNAKSLSEDFSLYLHRPTASDPSLAPKGCDAFYVLSPVPHLESGTDWASVGEPYRQAIEARLQERLLPGLKDEIVTSKLFTPQDFRDRLLSVNGAAFGLEPVLTQSAWFRPHNRSESLKNLYLVGAGTHPGAGVPGVLSSAKVLDTVVPHASALA